MRLLRNWGYLPESGRVASNRAFLRNRQQSQLDILQDYTRYIDQTLIIQPLSVLSGIKHSSVFHSFAAKCSSNEYRSMNSFADVNIERAIAKGLNAIPFTVKDHLKVTDMIQTCGFSQNLQPSHENSEVVELLEREGCVAYAHTNVPQGLLGIVSSNPVYGDSKNPVNPAFISGGSSGGEAAQVALGGSAFGIGSDSAGSIRIPASFCGVYGFKPTGSKRLSNRGRVGPSGTQVSPSFKDLDSSLGFIGRTVDDIEWLCERTIGKTTTPNPQIIHPWSKTAYEAAKSKKLKIGYMIDCEEIRTCPAIRNAILQTVQMLKSNGHQVTEWNIPHLLKFRNFFFQFVKISGFLTSVALRVQDEVISHQAKKLNSMGLFGSLASRYYELTAGSDIEAAIFRNFHPSFSLLSLYKAIRAKDVYRDDFNRQWEQKGFDILLSPVMPFTAPLHNQNEMLVTQLTFCAYHNILQLPAISIPIRTVRSQETVPNDNRAIGSMIRRSIEKSIGLPVGIQLTGKYLQDETCLAAAHQISSMLKSRK